MSLVGDIILDLRARIPDAPMVGGLVEIFVTPINTATGTLYGGLGLEFAGTAVNEFGESQPSNGFYYKAPGATSFTQMTSVIWPAGYNTAQVTFNNLGVYGRCYLGAANYAYWWQSVVQGQGQISLLVGGGADSVGPGIATIGSGIPPTRSTYFLPDTDGNFIGAFTMFRLLNRALQAMVKIAGGIVDVTGVQSQINQSMYRLNTPVSTNPYQSAPLNSPFYQFTNAWYDGYPMDVVPRSMMYLRNSAAGFSGILSYEQDGPQSTIQVWPQSNRTGGQTYLYQNMGATDNFALVADASGFLSIGLAQIDQEIMTYSSITKVPQLGPPAFQLYQLNGITRGLGGTDAVTHNGYEGGTGNYALVTELNIRLSGYRMCETYAVGDSYKTIMVPQAWEEPLVLHMLSQVRSMEQDDAAAKSLMTDFVQMAEKIAKGSRLGRLKPRQIPIWGQTSTDARNVNGIGFGWLIN